MMSKCEFRMNPEDVGAIQRRLDTIQSLIKDRDELVALLENEVQYLNTIFRAASAEAKLVDGELQDVEIPVMLDPSGVMNVKIQNNVASWKPKTGSQGAPGPTDLSVGKT